MIDQNLCPILISLIKQDSELHIKMEAIWAIANLCFGDESHIDSIIKRDFHKLLPNILTSPFPSIYE